MGNDLGNCWTELAEWEQIHPESFLTPTILNREEERVDILERFAHYEIYDPSYGSTTSVIDEIEQISQEEPCTVLLPESQMQQGMLAWPQKEFSDKLCEEAKFGSKPFKILVAGHRAVDFTLLDTRGNPVSLSSLLKTKAVVLTSGQNSCPHFKGSVNGMNELARKYGHAVHFLCVNTMQPFPSHPDLSFLTGKVWETRYTKECGPQPRNYESRVPLAAKVQKVLNGWTVLVDDLPSSPEMEGKKGKRERINPYWSTYGPAERAAYLIDQSGLIASAQLWFNEESLGEEIQKLCQVEAEDGTQKSFLGRVGEVIRTRTMSSSSLNKIVETA